MKHKFLFLIVLLAFAMQTIAQQDPHYSHFMFNQPSYNPAYCGTSGMINGTMIYRDQWMGLTGGPKTLMLSADAPVRLFGTSGGAGITLINDEIGYESNFTAKLAILSAGRS